MQKYFLLGKYARGQACADPMKALAYKRMQVHGMSYSGNICIELEKPKMGGRDQFARSGVSRPMGAPAPPRGRGCPGARFPGGGPVLKIKKLSRRLAVWRASLFHQDHLFKKGRRTYGVFERRRQWLEKKKTTINFSYGRRREK